MNSNPSGWRKNWGSFKAYYLHQFVSLFWMLGAVGIGLLLRENNEWLKNAIDFPLMALLSGIFGIMIPNLAQFEKAGVDSIRAGGFTIYLERTLWAGAVDGDNEALMKALKRAKLGVYVKTSVNTQSLSAYARELDRNGKKPPPSLKPHLKVTEVFKVKARKSG